MAPEARHILVVDDSADNRDLLSQLLEDEGYRVTEAADGEAALLAIGHERPDLVLLDLLMPVLDGFGVLKRLQALDGPFLPVVVVTANSEPEARLHALKLGAQELLPKPIDRYELLVRLETLLALKDARDELRQRNERLEEEVSRRTQELAQQKQELAAANEELRRLDRAKDEFLSVLSHELRTPLNFIMSSASILDDEVQGPLNDAQHTSMGRILDGSERLLTLVNNLLDFASIQAGELRLDPRPTAYASLVRDVAAALAPQANAKRLAVTVEIPLDSEPTIDGPRVSKALTHLLDNAIKFSPEGGRVRVKALERDGWLITTVEDAGRGIAPADQPKLFDRFHQADMSATREAGGVGLGLAITKALIEAHGGTIGVRSATGEGAIFWFELPVGGSDMDSRQAMASRQVDR